MEGEAGNFQSVRRSGRTPKAFYKSGSRTQKVPGRKEKFDPQNRAMMAIFKRSGYGIKTIRMEQGAYFIEIQSSEKMVPDDASTC
jgi:hypothetical protein